MADPFQPKFVDLVRNYTTTLGTDDFVLGPAANGFADFTAALQVGDQFYYAALGVDNPADTEVGRGTLLAGGVIARDPIDGTKTDFKSGTKAVSLISAADWFQQAHAFVGSVSAVGQSIVSAATAVDARTALAIDHIAVNPSWYGLIEGDDPANGDSNSAGMTAMFADMAATGRFRVAMPAGTYWFANTIDIDIGNLLIEGAAAGGLDECSSVLKFPAGVTGIRIQNDQSSGATATDAEVHSSGGGTVLRNLTLIGSFATTEAEAHGVQIRRHATLENLTIRYFEGDGIYAAASIGAQSGETPPHGNDNMLFITRCSIAFCRNGIYFSGTDANACTIVMANVIACRQWGIFDSSFLGNTYLGGQLAANGTTTWNDGVTIGASVVSENGNLFGAIVGQESWCSTNAPSGTTADNQGWYYISAGAPAAGMPAWTSGMLIRAGGAAHTDSLNGENLFSGVYAEVDQGKAQLCEPSLVTGGILARWCCQVPTASGALMTPVIRGGQNNGAVVHAEPALECASGQVTATLGAVQGNAQNVVLNAVHSTYCPAGYQIHFSPAFNGDMRLTYAGGSANAWFVTTPSTHQQFGTGIAQSHIFYPVKLAVGASGEGIVNARRLMIDAVVPASGFHGQGEWCFHRGATPGLIGWKCTAAGAPGTWEAVYSGYGTAPIGYAAGAGGTVVQSGSKSASVTLDKLCGQITTDAENLEAGATVAFTVNNSEVAATDAIELVLASGNAVAGTYNYQVDRVGAGSFVICVRNVSGGPLSEALVFNFAVKKAVAA